MHIPRLRPRAALRCATTLIELLVVLAILGTLTALLLAGVQASRDAARRVTCSNHLRQQVLALQAFHAAHGRFPAGRRWSSPHAEYGWYIDLLPYLEQAALAGRFDQRQPWNAPVHEAAASTNLRVLLCPAALLKFPGKTDYGGIQGSLLAGASTPGRFEFNNGVLIELGRGRQAAIRLADVTDGASQTLVAAESADRAADGPGRWASPLNIFSHDNGQINGDSGGDIYSLHPGGAWVGFADGHVQFFSRSMEASVVGALCTRDGGETVLLP
jgi:prepilin-type processing-associated H-X9-DG protein